MFTHNLTHQKVMANTHNLYIILTIISISLYTSLCQQVPASNSCNGIFLSYNYTAGYPIPPNVSINQPYRFESTLTVLNNGLDELKSWRVFVGFKHDELLVSATKAVLADGTSLPAKVGNGTVFVGYPETDLKSAVETAGDLNQMQAQILLVGTQFGVGGTDVPLPASLTLANDGFSCPNATSQGNEMYLCCTKDLNSISNITVENNFLTRQEGDLLIMYDVIKSYETNYWAQVSISNHNPLGRLENWKLSWDWMSNEFIHTMKGAYPYLVDTSECIFGPQGQYYQDLDFSQALNCERRPTIIDLPPTRANDPILGNIPFCCRNGTILPPHMNASKSASVFQMHVYKMPPDINRTELIPPQNIRINGTMNPDYQCGTPVRVSPSLFQDPSGLPSEIAAIASWQVVCNITQSKEASPKCCVSFSAFFNDSAIPCNTCACGCKHNPSQTCSATTPALLQRPDALLVPFENRTSGTLAWAAVKRLPVPNPLPCSDNCGISINWHLATDYRGGWSARITLFNWGETDFADWFAAVELDKAGPGFEKVYSLNGSALPGSISTIFMEGLPGLNHLPAEKDGANPKKYPRVPGFQQSVISFTKKMTPDINVAQGDGFPTKVFFNGEECALPAILPTSNAHKMSKATWVISILTLLALFSKQ